MSESSKSAAQQEAQRLEALVIGIQLLFDRSEQTEFSSEAVATMTEVGDKLLPVISQLDPTLADEVFTEAEAFLGRAIEPVLMS